jgi:hypothetical protein
MQIIFISVIDLHSIVYICVDEYQVNINIIDANK